MARVPKVNWDASPDRVWYQCVYEDAAIIRISNATLVKRRQANKIEVEESGHQ